MSFALPRESGLSEYDFAWTDAERLIRFGDGALTQAPELLRARGFDDWALLSTPRALQAAPGGLREGAGVVLAVAPGRVDEVSAAIWPAVGGRPLVALGGGRVIDSAKAIAGADDLPCAAIPTTLSGAEMTRIHRSPKGAERPRLVRPSLVIAEPSLMASQPMPDVAASAMNALAHAVEALYGPRANPVATLAGLRAAELISAALALEEPDRPALALGALLAAYALDSAGLALHHVACQTIVRVTGSPHAGTNAVMLPHVIAFVAPRAPDLIGRLAVALGADEPRPELAPQQAAAITARTGATRLGELGVRAEQLGEVVDAILARPDLANTPGPPPGERDVRQLLERAL